MITEKKSFYFFVTVFIILISVAIPASANMTVLSDSILEQTIGEGLQISFTGNIGITVPNGTAIGFGTTNGFVSLSSSTLSNCRILNSFEYDDDNNITTPDITINNPLKLSTNTGDGSDPCIPNGTGYINIEMPSLSLKTDSFSADLATDNNMSVSGIQKIFGLSYSTAQLNLYSGEIKVFAH